MQTVRVYDQEGRQIEIPIEEWRSKVLPANLEEANDDPDSLYRIILDSVQQGLAQDVLTAATRLRQIDRIPERGTTLYCIVLLNTGNPQLAESTLNEYVAKQGVSGVILTNLAKAQTALGRKVEAEKTLWQAIQADPNQENGLGWYGAIHRELNPASGWQEAMQRAAILPRAWLPRLWLARAALERNSPSQALDFYAEAINNAGQPAPTLLLQMMSGDLGKQGMLEDAIRLARPHYSPKLHGLNVGNNLIKAELNLGNIAAAKTLIAQLAALNRPDWIGTLQYWDNEIKNHTPTS